MKLNSRTAMFGTVVLAAILLAPGRASRGKASDLTNTGTTPDESKSVEQSPGGRGPAMTQPPAAMPVKPLQFELFKVQNRKSITELESRLGAEGFETILRINRIDRRHIRVGDSLLVPNSVTNLNDSSPFPIRLEIAQNIPKLILVCRSVQAFGAYESGTLVRWGPTSTGKKSTPTPPRLYYTNWKSKSRRSSVNQNWILPWCFNLDENEGISFHQFDLPGYPASHGCVRLLEEDAKWIFEWADQWILSKTDQSIAAYGTPVLIFGDYNYNQKPVWKGLNENPNAASIATKEIEVVLNKDLASIELRSRARHPEKLIKDAPSTVASIAKTQ